MNIKKRRIGRIRNELRAWLREHSGQQAGYTLQEIDRGREDLGFHSADDALIAYTLFGGDLAPDFCASAGLSLTAEDIRLFTESLHDGSVADFDWFGTE